MRSPAPTPNSAARSEMDPVRVSVKAVIIKSNSLLAVHIVGSKGDWAVSLGDVN